MQNKTRSQSRSMGRKTSTKKSKKRRNKTRKNGTGGGTLPPVFGPQSSNGGNGSATYARKKSKDSSYKLPSIAPWKIILTSFVIGIFGVLYISHVFQTQQLLREVKSMEQQYKQAKREHEQYELQYERLTGPRQIYKKAKELDFTNAGPVEQVITIEP